MTPERSLEIDNGHWARTLGIMNLVQLSFYCFNRVKQCKITLLVYVFHTRSDLMNCNICIEAKDENDTREQPIDNRHWLVQLSTVSTVFQKWGKLLKLNIDGPVFIVSSYA